MTDDEYAHLEPWQLEELAHVERVLGRCLTPEDRRKITWTYFGLGEEWNGIKLRPTLWVHDDLGEEYGRRCETGSRRTMNILLWGLQVLAALLYGASGVMKLFMFDKISAEVPSFGALPREASMALGILELVCAAWLIVPAAFRRRPSLTLRNSSATV